MTMSTPIAQNTTALEELLEIAESLPDATEAPVLQSKSVTPTKSAQTVKPDTGYDGLSEVTVDAIPSKYIEPSGTKSITANGTHDVTSYASASVNVSAKVQEKSVTPTTSAQTVTPDSGYDGLSKVSVGAVKTATQATPGISVSSSGLITASATQTEGYVSAGTKSATKQLTTQAAQTITPGTSDKTIASGRYLTGTQTVKGDSNLVAANIKSGVAIFGVTGTHEGGVTVQTKTGTVKSAQTINCGFKPDLVVIRNTEAGADGWYHPAFAFTAMNMETLLAQAEITGGFYYFGVTRTATGFKCDYVNFYDFDWNWSGSNYTGSFNYTAVKYT
jgi:hypothetical protein